MKKYIAFLLIVNISLTSNSMFKQVIDTFKEPVIDYIAQNLVDSIKTKEELKKEKEDRKKLKKERPCLFAMIEGAKNVTKSLIYSYIDKQFNI